MKRKLGILRCYGDDDIKIDVNQIEYSVGVDRIKLILWLNGCLSWTR
jgi:hypothetical protein